MERPETFSIWGLWFDFVAVFDKFLKCALESEVSKFVGIYCVIFLTFFQGFVVRISDQEQKYILVLQGLKACHRCI
jgi:hypothetical protein